MESELEIVEGEKNETGSSPDLSEVADTLAPEALSTAHVIIERVENAEPLTSIAYMDSLKQGAHNASYDHFMLPPDKRLFEVSADVAAAACACLNCGQQLAAHSLSAQVCSDCGEVSGFHHEKDGALLCRSNKPAQLEHSPKAVLHCRSGVPADFRFVVSPESRVRLK